MASAPRLIFVLLGICLCSLFSAVDGVCETEEDLDFESCELKDMKDTILKDICNRMGLDIDSQVLPSLYDEEYEYLDEQGYTTTRTYAHDDYVKGAEECLRIEEEMAHLEENDPEYLKQLEYDALAEDPDFVAEIISDFLEGDETLLKETALKLEKDAPDAVKEIQHMLEEGEKLDGRPDVIALVIAKLLQEGQDLEVLNEFDAFLETFYDDDWEDEWPEDEDNDFGEGDEF